MIDFMAVILLDPNCGVSEVDWDKVSVPGRIGLMTEL
jgi:hypothetical protein